jgi:CheY-like chemotaxis protein
VTEQRRLQEQVVLSERMSSLGTLAAGIAHEINNPLSFVLANVRFASDGLRELHGVPGELHAALGDAAEGARRVQEIVRDLKTFARGEPRGGTTEDLGAVVRSAITLAQNEIKYRARLRLDLPALPPASGAPHRLGQVFLNLLVNSAQALPEGRVDEHEISVRAGTTRDRIWIEVADDGAGVPPELRQQIFDPFFTTKPAGVGTGLGLSICHAIVTDAGGTLALVPSERGAVFRVELPVARPAAATPVPARGPEPRARVLVIDDEPQVGKALERLLGPFHDVAYVGSARDALAQLAEGRPYDVVLCDLMMPDLTGMDFYEELARRDPLLAERVAFITGGAFTPRAREFLERNRNERLDKPFDPEALREVVSRLAASA